jgi:DNA-binding Lrp family transcriptional regulator
MKPKLSENEREVLKQLIRDGSVSCAEMGREMGISSQAVGKIKKRLEEKGIVRGYNADIDYSKLGIDTFAIAFFRFKSGSMGEAEENNLKGRIKGPHLLKVYLLNEGDYSHAVIYGFRTLRDLENYFQKLQKQRNHISELKKVYIISGENIMKDDSKDLLLKVIKGGDGLSEPERIDSFLGKNVLEKSFFY